MSAKRKFDVSRAKFSTKKEKIDTSLHASAKAILAAVDSGFENSELELNDKNAVRKAFAEIANYVASLEHEVKELKKAQANATVGASNAQKSPEQITQEADRLLDTVVRGIKRLLVWKPSCKLNTAKFAYDGICTDPLVFGAMLNMDGPPSFKQKRMLGAEFEDLIREDIIGSARYNDLYISKQFVTIRYNAETGEFKISGSYGISRTRRRAKSVAEIANYVDSLKGEVKKTQMNAMADQPEPQKSPE
ncbi:hypothetical protein A7U60_g5758 [Sanghuangporus baumii]|uniref:Uncharacterized protein n=1 Tax=Sanghuangporus baumii TaxID=108892 RepID=A0A9Q5N7U5_SANBA|nr:hypothetical protein A7U60_g5758 [Sanghuangporus baumii]